MLEAPSRVERLPGPPRPTPGAKVANSGLGRSVTRVCGWSVSLVTPVALAPSVEWLLSFRNYYTASVRVDLMLSDGETVTAVDKLALMQHLHYEDDAQNWHLIKLELPDSTDLERGGRILMGVRVYCHQPSPIWAKWELHNVKLYRHEKTTTEPSTALTKDADTRNVGVHRSPNAKTVEQAIESPSRSALSSPTGSGDRGTQPHLVHVDVQAARCLDLVLRIRQLLADPTASSY